MREHFLQVAMADELSASILDRMRDMARKQIAEQDNVRLRGKN